MVHILIVHSATKWIDGQGRVLGGVIVGEAKLIKDIYLFCRNTGPALISFQCMDTKQKFGNA